ncbi:MAG: M23 family metallopeptidase [Alistipes sp.]|nr:M23 family metallopeptidase [Alistipes sp.]
MTQKPDTLPTAAPTRSGERTRREETKAPLRLRIYRLLRKTLIGFILVSIANVIFSQFFFTPKMYRIDRENRELMIRYRILQDRIRTAQNRADEIRHRDSHVYRSLFSTDTVAIPGADRPYPDEKYASMADDEFAPMMIGTWKQLDALARTLYQESVSFDELQVLSKDKARLAAAIPAIWPIDRKALHGDHIGAFNPRRMHPIYHRIIAHLGIDLGCDRGTPVYATGDATVQKVDIGEADRGYGKQILLNHKFGYQTRYAHLSKILVKPGDRVLRGQIIGETGNTGGSTAPHLHYEVIRMGTPVNPVNYFNRNMTYDEYDRFMERMRETNFEIM